MSDAPQDDPLERARRAIDGVDDRLLALVAERAALAAEIAAAKGKIDGSPMRPAREIALLRRLIAAAPAALEKALVVEVWRALIGDNLRRQKGIEVFVGGSAGGALDQLKLYDVARRHFGAGVRISTLPDPRTVLTRMVETPAAAAVLPFPGRAGAGLWWPILSERKFHDAVVAAALPLIGDGGEPQAALLTTGVPLEEAGGDTTLAFAQDPNHRLVRGLNEGKLQGREIARAGTAVLIQLDGYVSPNDPRLVPFARAGLDGLRVVGCYARL